MTLASGDLTTPQRVQNWIPNGPTLPSVIISQLIGSMTALIYNKLNRARTYSQTFVRTFDGVGNMQLVLPDFPVTAIASVQQGQAVIPASVLPPSGSPQPQNTSPWYGYRWVPWSGNLPGDPVVLEFANGFFWTFPQNIKVTYTAGYLIQSEPWLIPATPFQVTVLQPQGIWCRDNGVVYADTGVVLTPVSAITGAGQYIPPTDALPGQYTFGTADAGQNILISYSFIPADLEEACIQMVAERYYYRTRVGEISKSLGGQETIRWARGPIGRTYAGMSSLPPEVMDLIWPYVYVAPPAIGAPV
jgi:hypothetical protein